MVDFQTLLIIFTLYTTVYDPHPKFHALFEFLISFSKCSSPEKHLRAFLCLLALFLFALRPKVKHGFHTEWQLTTQGPTFCRNTPSLIATPPWKGPTFKGNLKQALRAFFSLENLENSWFLQLEMRFPGARPNAHRPTSLKPAEYSFSYTKG